MPLHQLSARPVAGQPTHPPGHTIRQGIAPHLARGGWSAQANRSPTRALQTDDFPALGGTAASHAHTSSEGLQNGGGGGEYMPFRYDQQQQQQQQSSAQGGHGPVRQDDFPALGDAKDLQAHRNALLGAMTGGRATPPMMGGNNGNPGTHTMHHAGNNNNMGRSRMQAPPNLSLMSGPPALDAPPKATDRDGVPMPSHAPGLSGIHNNSNSSSATRKEEPVVNEQDRYTINGLLPIIRKPASDHAMLSLGFDLTHLGLKLGPDDDRLLSSLWMSPFADPNAAGGIGGQVSLSTGDALANRFTPPACYVMGGISAVLPEASNKIASFAEETLFYIFYTQPRSKMQELAAQELTLRNWRFHKVLGFWLTKEPGVDPSIRTATMERGQYIFWDAGQWERVKKVFELFYEDLEDRFGTANGAAAGVPVQGQPQSHEL